MDLLLSCCLTQVHDAQWGKQTKTSEPEVKFTARIRQAILDACAQKTWTPSGFQEGVSKGKFLCEVCRMQNWIVFWLAGGEVTAVIKEFWLSTF